MRRAHGDHGAYLILYAVLTTAAFAMVALVLDLAALRQGRQADRAAADLAATAGAGVLDPLDPSTFSLACRAAWGYVVANRDDAGGAASAPDCAARFPATPCDPSTPSTATGTYGPLTVSITYPVPDGDPLMRSEVQGGDRPQVVDPARDGLVCQRLGVRIQRSRTFLFGGIVGIGDSTTDVHAVARRTIETGPDVPAAVALERTGCPAVLATDGSLRVVPAAPGAPATLVVDTDLSGCAGYALEAVAPAGEILAGEIEAYALSGPNAARVRTGTVNPAPVGVTTRLGRGFLDARYNCGPACGEAQGDLDALRAAYGAGAPAGLTPHLAPCTIPAGPPVILAADAYVACPVLRVEGSVTFLGDTAVLDGDLEVTATGCVAVNNSACGAVVLAPHPAVTLFVRGSVRKEDKGDVVLTNTFTYVAGTITVPRADPLGTSALRATAPQSGDFEDLLVWSDTAGDVFIGEQQSFVLEGTIAAPDATVVLSAKPSGGPVTAAQVVARRIRLAETGSFTLSPSAGRATGAVARQVKLIR